LVLYSTLKKDYVQFRMRTLIQLLQETEWEFTTMKQCDITWCLPLVRIWLDVRSSLSSKKLSWSATS